MTDAAESTFLIRPAIEVDRPRLISLINAAFAVETFLEGTRTDEERLAAMRSLASPLP